MPDARHPPARPKPLRRGEGPMPDMITAGLRHEITRDELLLRWLQNDRNGKLTSWGTICKRFCLMKDLKGTLQTLVDADKVKKLKHGYKAKS